MLISVIIPTCNRAATLKTAIDGIIANGYEDYEIIVVDQSVKQDTRDLVMENYSCNKKIVYIYSNTKCSSDSRNKGWERASGEFVAFTDDDAYVDKSWLWAYADLIKSSKQQVGMVGGRIIPVFEKPRPQWLPPEKDYFLPSFDAGDTTRPFPDNCLPISVNLLAPKKLLQEIGGFDTRLGLKHGAEIPYITGEDSYLGVKARKAGFSITYLPSAVVYHPITAERLTKKFFLTRSFREGATTIAVENVKATCTLPVLSNHIKWHSKNLAFLLAKLLGRAVVDSSSRSKSVMLTASEIAFSIGVIHHSLYLKRKLQSQELS